MESAQAGLKPVLFFHGGLLGKASFLCQSPLKMAEKAAAFQGRNFCWCLLAVQPVGTFFDKRESPRLNRYLKTSALGLVKASVGFDQRLLQMRLWGRLCF